MWKIPPRARPNSSTATATPKTTMTMIPSGEAWNRTRRSETPLASQISSARPITISIGVRMTPERP
jgi:hypothetical protein